MTELFRALGALLEPPRADLARIADALELGALPSAAEHTEAIVFSLYPYASVYLGAEGMMGGEARDRIAGFFRALGSTPSAEPDHVTVLLASYTAISGDERLAHAQKALFWEHLASFLPAYASAMESLGIDFYARWAQVLSSAIRSEAEKLGPPASTPRHLDTPPLAFDDGTSLTELLSGILAPVRSGIILVRRDVVRAARELGLAARAGERRWALSALLSQDAPGVLAWLAREGETWARRHRSHDGNPVSEEWAKRAERTSEVLSKQAMLAREAHHVLAV